MDEHALHNLDPQLVHHPLIPDLPHSSQPFDATQFVHSDFNLSKIYSSSHNHLGHHHNLNSFDLAHDFHHIGLFRSCGRPYSRYRLLGLQPVVARLGYIGTPQPTAPIPGRKATLASRLLLQRSFRNPPDHHRFELASSALFLV